MQCRRVQGGAGQGVHMPKQWLTGKHACILRIGAINYKPILLTLGD